jgi:hypothetical protein
MPNEHLWTTKSKEGEYSGRWHLECCGHVVRGKNEHTTTHAKCPKCGKRSKCYLIGSQAWIKWILTTEVVPNLAKTTQHVQRSNP